MKAGKTPYEIRAELLHLAFEILSEQHTAKAAATHRGDRDLVIPTSPTTDEIIAEADKLNAFVSKAALERNLT